MSTQLGLQFRDAGLDSVEQRSMTFQERMRWEAIRICRRKGYVDSDDLRELAEQEGIEPHHPNAWGAIFRGKEWRSVGFSQSRIASNHARLIRRWAYQPKGQRNGE